MSPDSTRHPCFPFREPSREARLRLFCLPFAGGGASFYRDWGKDLPAGVDVCPIQLPGRETRLREPPHQRIEPLLEEVLTALRPWTGLPYALFGHSMGALIVFELARKLSGTPPVHVYVSGNTAPQLEIPSSLRHDLTDQEFMDVLLRMEGMNPEILASPELMQMLIPRMRADCEANDYYRYYDAPPLACPLSVYDAADDPQTTPDSVEAWSENTTAEFASHRLEGGHFFLQSQRAAFMARFAGELQADLDRLPAGT